MQDVFQVHIPQPCHERWDAMHPNAQGRFCDSCAQTVVDFTGMSHAAILQALHKTAGNCCGRFNRQQLDRPLLAHSAQRVPFKWPALTAAALVSLVMLTWGGTAHAQQSAAATVAADTLPPPPIAGKVAMIRMQAVAFVDLRHKPLRDLHLCWSQAGAAYHTITDKQGHAMLEYASLQDGLALTLFGHTGRYQEVVIDIKGSTAPVMFRPSGRLSAAEMKQLLSK